MFLSTLVSSPHEKVPFSIKSGFSVENVGKSGGGETPPAEKVCVSLSAYEGYYVAL